MVRKTLNEESSNDIISKLEPYKNQLKKTADRLFGEGVPTTQFMRVLNQAIQYYAKEDISSSDDFYTDRDEMKKVLHWLGYDSTKFGISKSNK